MSDLGDRADDYERRLAQAGSTEHLVRGLVSNVHRGRRIIRLLIITLVVDFVLSLAMAGLALTALNEAKLVEKNAAAIQRNADLVVSEVYRQCLVDRDLNIEVTNVYQTLIRAVELTDSIPPAEKVDRVKKYRAAMPPGHVCTKPS